MESTESYSETGVGMLNKKEDEREIKIIKEIDCFGEICPIPILRILQELKTMKKNQTLKVVSDHSCVVQSVTDHLKKETVEFFTEEVINGVWEIYVTKK